MQKSFGHFSLIGGVQLFVGEVSLCLSERPTIKAQSLYTFPKLIHNLSTCSYIYHMTNSADQNYTRCMR